MSDNLANLHALLLIADGPGDRETLCSAGGAGRVRGPDVVNILTSYMGIQEKYGA
jgi:hypothetical protein